MSLTPWQQYKKNLGNTRPWDLLNPKSEKVSDDLASERLDLCSKCPEFINATKQCKKCGCIMTLKTKLAEATCPLGKW